MLDILSPILQLIHTVIQLSPILQVDEKPLFKKLNSFFETKFSSYQYGFCLRNSTEHALSNLLYNWKNYLGKSKVFGTILIDISRYLIVYLPFDYQLSYMLML